MQYCKCNKIRIPIPTPPFPSLNRYIHEGAAPSSKDRFAARARANFHAHARACARTHARATHTLTHTNTQTHKHTHKHTHTQTHARPHTTFTETTVATDHAIDFLPRQFHCTRTLSSHATSQTKPHTPHFATPRINPRVALDVCHPVRRGGSRGIRTEKSFKPSSKTKQPQDKLFNTRTWSYFLLCDP